MAQLAEFATNHPFLVAGLIAALLAVIVHEIRLKSQAISQVSVVDAVRLINKGAVVIDVRNAEAYQAGHIVNARHVALDTLDADKPPLSKLKAKPVLAVCDTGGSAAKAANTLRQKGFENTFSLRGGLAAWRAQNLPLIK
jgi:rhodanese-related sulfurtransferase